MYSYSILGFPGNAVLGHKAHRVNNYSTYLSDAFSILAPKHVELSLSSSSVPTKEELLQKLNYFYISNKDLIIDKTCLITSPQIKDIHFYIPILQEWALLNKINKVIYITQVNSDLSYDSEYIKIKYLNPITYILLEMGLNNWMEKNVNREVTSHYNYLTYTVKPHRAYMYSLLKKYKLLNYGIISFNQAITNNYNSFSDLPPLIGITEEEYKSNLTDKVYVDLPKDIKHDQYRIGSTPTFLDTVSSTAISVVADSTYTNSYNFITEKTFNNFGLKKPFLLIANKGNLQFLRDYYGFKTFSSLWDESYDLEDSISIRTASVFKILTNLCKLPLKDLIHKINAIEEILEYNYDTYNNLPHRKWILEAITY
jgi:hypothetical protein